VPPKSAKPKDRRKKEVKVNGGNRSLLSPPEDDDGTTCDTISFTHSELEEEEGMKLGANDVLRQATQEEELHVKYLRGEPFVANRRGLRLAENVGVVEQQFARIISLQQQIAEIPLLKIKIGSLKDRVSSLTC